MSTLTQLPCQEHDQAQKMCIPVNGGDCSEPTEGSGKPRAAAERGTEDTKVEISFLLSELCQPTHSRLYNRLIIMLWVAHCHFVLRLCAGRMGPPT